MVVVGGAFALNPISTHANITATASDTKLIVNGENVAVDSYLINSSNYIKLRDIATMINYTNKKFDVSWDSESKTVLMVPGSSYTATGGEMVLNTGASKTATYDKPAISVGLLTATLDSYIIDQNYYFKLRDVLEILDVYVGWDQTSYSATIDTNKTCDGDDAVSSIINRINSSVVSTMSTSYSTSRWSSVYHQYNYIEDGLLHAASAGVYSTVVLRSYDLETFDVVDYAEYSSDLSLYGGFYKGEEYIYIVCGQSNPDYDDDAIVFQITKHDSDLNVLGTLSITGGECYTDTPFRAGSLTMSEEDGQLVVHTSRLRYDGHQSQVTFIIDSENMELLNTAGSFQANHVSHSFNQYVQHENDTHYLLDHADGYPRAIVMSIYNPTNGSYTKKNLLSIPGATGANCTGVTLGGFEVNETTALAVLNRVDWDSVTEFTSYKMEGLTLDLRDIVLLVHDLEQGSTTEITLASYIDTGNSGSTPRIVALDDGNYMVLWQTFLRTSDVANLEGTYCTVIDKFGNIVTPTTEIGGAIPYSLLPIYDDGTVYWFLSSFYYSELYRLDVDTLTYIK